MQLAMPFIGLFPCGSSSIDDYESKTRRLKARLEAKGRPKTE